MGWIDEAKDLSLHDIAHRIGLEVKGRYMMCPCGCQRRGKGDRRLPCTVYTGGRWKCYACGASGDGIDIVSHALLQDRYTGQEQVRSWFKDQTEIQIRTKEEEPAPLMYPDRKMIWTIWQAGKIILEPIHDEWPHGLAARWIAARLGTSALYLRRVRELVREVQPVYPTSTEAHKITSSWDRTAHLAMMPMYDADGLARNLRARLVDEGRTREDGTPLPKSKSIGGYQCGGLMLCNRTAVEMLRGLARPLRVVICEGEPDLLAWTAQEPVAAVLGTGSGWYTHEHGRKIPNGAEVLIATDRDAAGDRYADIIIQDLGQRCYLTRWRA